MRFLGKDDESDLSLLLLHQPSMASDSMKRSVEPVGGERGERNRLAAAGVVLAVAAAYQCFRLVADREWNDWLTNEKLTVAQGGGQEAGGRKAS